MKLKMLQPWSEREDHPQKDDILDVQDIIRDGPDVEGYQCKWKNDLIMVYPYECEVVSE